MSREEAAAIYLDKILGFPGKYSEYREASDTLSEDDKNLLTQAAAAWLRDGLRRE